MEYRLPRTRPGCSSPTARSAIPRPWTRPAPSFPAARTSMEPSMRGERAFAFAFTFAFSIAANAEVIDASVQTLVAGRSDPRDGKLYSVVPIYETVSLL